MIYFKEFSLAFLCRQTEAAPPALRRSSTPCPLLPPRAPRLALLLLLPQATSLLRTLPRLPEAPLDPPRAPPCPPAPPSRPPKTRPPERHQPEPEPEPPPHPPQPPPPTRTTAPHHARLAWLSYVSVSRPATPPAAAAIFVMSIKDPVLTPMSSPSFVLTAFSMWMQTRTDRPKCTPGALPSRPARQQRLEVRKVYPQRVK